MKDHFRDYFDSLTEALTHITASDKAGKNCPFDEAMELTAQKILAVSARGRKLMLVGNGASAAISSHIATDFWKTNGIRAVAFNDPSGLTCISNDFSYQQVFEKPIEMFADDGDMLVAISSSGRSANILKAVAAARGKKAAVLTLSGFDEDNPLRRLGDINFYVPAYGYGFVEVVHHAICHSLIDIIKETKSESVERIGSYD